MDSKPFKLHSSVSFALVSANRVNTGSPEGCGAPGLEKAPIDGGISQGALCLWSLAQSALFKTLFPPLTDPG